MAFKKKAGGSVSLDTPVSMYQDIRPRKIEGLLEHQAQMLRQYAAKATEAKDVALQLPTGSGKTLVGLVLAEWRRRKLEERAVFLCPTRQLVNQVVRYSNEEYGIRALAFTGKQADYDGQAKKDWLTGSAVAVTTYSGLFNINPFFKDPHLIVLDDAHAAEAYIADHWTVRISRSAEETAKLYKALAAVLKPALNPLDYQRLSSPPGSLSKFEVALSVTHGFMFCCTQSSVCGWSSAIGKPA